MQEELGLSLEEFALQRDQEPRVTRLGWDARWGTSKYEITRFGRNQTLFDFGLEAGGEEDGERVGLTL